MKSLRFLCAISALGMLCAPTLPPVVAAPWIDMGAKDDFAFDQPHVSFELLTSGGVSLGPDGGGFLGFTNDFLLDTGATSTIAMNDAETELRGNGYVSENTVLEQGVAGYSELAVSAPYTVKITGSDGSLVSLPNSRIMSGQFPDLFGVNGIVGMTAMKGRVVTLDETIWQGIHTLDDLFDAQPLGAHFSSTLPASNGHRYSATVVAKRFDVTGDQPLPSSAPISLIHMSVGAGGIQASGNFAVDTGAAISFISPAIATQLGLDSNHDGQFGPGDEQFQDTLPIGGIGGTIDAPLYLIDKMSVPTDQGVDLVWNLQSQLSVLVVDISPNIDGVLGADLLTSGWVDLDALLTEGGQSKSGPIEKIHFDFRQLLDENDVGKIYFDLSPSSDVVHAAVTGDIDGDGKVDAADFVLWRKTGSAPQDYELWRSSFGVPQSDSASTSLPASAPEPGGAFLLAFAAACGLARRQKRPLTRSARSAASMSCAALSAP